MCSLVGRLPYVTRSADSGGHARPSAAYVVALLVAGGEVLGLEVKTTYAETSVEGAVWAEWLTFCVKVRGLCAAQLCAAGRATLCCRTPAANACTGKITPEYSRNHLTRHGRCRPATSAAARHAATRAASSTATFLPTRTWRCLCTSWPRAARCCWWAAAPCRCSARRGGSRPGSSACRCGCRRAANVHACFWGACCPCSYWCHSL